MGELNSPTLGGRQCYSVTLDDGVRVFAEKGQRGILKYMIHNLSLEEITKIGQKFYVEELKMKLEEKHMGEYVVIDVDEKKYKIDADRLAAVEKARKEYGEKLFYIVQIGSDAISSINYTEKEYAWDI